MSDVKLEKAVKLRSTSRDIVKEIINFGVDESQKLDIIYFLSLELNDHSLTQQLAELLKKYRTKFNESEQEINITNKNKLIID